MAARASAEIAVGSVTSVGTARARAPACSHSSAVESSASRLRARARRRARRRRWRRRCRWRRPSELPPGAARAPSARLLLQSSRKRAFRLRTNGGTWYSSWIRSSKLSALEWRYARAACASGRRTTSTVSRRLRALRPSNRLDWLRLCAIHVRKPRKPFIHRPLRHSAVYCVRPPGATGHGGQPRSQGFPTVEPAPWDVRRAVRSISLCRLSGSGLRNRMGRGCLPRLIRVPLRMPAREAALSADPRARWLPGCTRGCPCGRMGGGVSERSALRVAAARWLRPERAAATCSWGCRWAGPTRNPEYEDCGAKREPGMGRKRWRHGGLLRDLRVMGSLWTASLLRSPTPSRE